MFETGDRVRLEAEGIIIGIQPGTDVVCFVVSDWGTQFLAQAQWLTLVEKSEDLRVGDVIQDSEGFFYKRTTDGLWLEFGSGDVCADHEAVRPLRLVARGDVLVSTTP